MGHNTKRTVVDWLVHHASILTPAPLDDVLKETEKSIGINVNREWAVTQLEAEGFAVAALPDQLVSRPVDKAL